MAKGDFTMSRTDRSAPPAICLGNPTRLGDWRIRDAARKHERLATMLPALPAPRLGRRVRLDDSEHRAMCQGVGKSY